MYKHKSIKLLVMFVLVTQILSSFNIHAANTILQEEFDEQKQSSVLMEEENMSNLIGDVNGDGSRDSIDLALMRTVLLGKRKDFPISNGLWASDVNGDGAFNSLDFAFMRTYLLGKIKEFPAESVETPTPTQTPTLTPTVTPTKTNGTTPTATPTNNQPNEKPEVPRDFHYVTKTESSVTLSWNGTNDNVSYDIYVDNEYFETTYGTSFTVNGLNKNTSYGFYVIAKDKAGNLSDPTDYIVVVTMDEIKSFEFTNVIGGSSHSIALNKDGTVWSWGENKGKLGNDSESESCVPVEVKNLVDIKEISVGTHHSLALRKDGTVWAWGFNDKFQCGIKSEEIYIKSPLQVKGINNVKQIGAILERSYILKNDGTLWQFGFEVKDFSQVANIGSIKSISTFATGYYLAALKNDSTVSLISYNNKIVHVDGLKDVERVICCPYYFIAIKNDGTVWCIETDGSYIQIPNVKYIKEVAGNNNDILLLKNDGTLYVIERNELSNYIKGIAKEVQIKNEFKDIVSIGSGHEISYIIKEDGTVWVFGVYNGNGMFGSGILKQNYPRKSEEKLSDENSDIIKSVFASYWGEYKLISNGIVKLVKEGSREVNFDSITNVKDIVAGDSCFFVLKDDGTVWSWGYNYSGQLGDGTSETRNYPVKVSNLEKIVKISTASNSVLALSEDGTVWSWGNNKYGQLGNGTNTNSYIPRKINNLSNVVDVIANNGYSIALLEDGTVWSWGDNTYGQLGDGTNVNRNIPVKVINLTNIVDIESYYGSSFAISEDGTVWSWGNNTYGQLGDGTNVNRNIPVKVKNLTDVVDIVLLYGSSFALKRDGTVWSWGNNDNGQLGNNGVGNTNTPSEIVGLSNIIYISAKNKKTIFVDYNMQIWECGAPIQYDTPTRVTMENDANLRYITIDNNFLESFDEDITEYNVILPPGTTKVPNVGLRTYNPYATYTIVQPDTVDGIAIIEVTAWDGETTKTYKIKFNQPSYAEYKESFHFGESGTGASGNFSRTYTDMTADAPGFKIAFSRTYNSMDNKVGSFGRGWTFGFESRIEDTGYIGVKKLTLPDGSVNLFEWDGEKYVGQNSRNKLTANSDGSFLLTTKDQYSYHYNSRGYLDWMKDRNGNVVTVNVNAKGKVNSIKDQCGRTYSVIYDDNGLIKRIIDEKAGRQVEYEYIDGNLRIVTDPSGIVTQYNYMQYKFDNEVGPVHVLYEVRDNEYNLIERIFCYEEGDNVGKVWKTIDKNGNQLTYNYYPNGLRNTVTDSNGKKTSYWYDESYFNTIVIDSEGGFSKTTYYLDEKGENKYGEILSYQDRNGNKTIYERDDNGNITKIKNPDNSVKEFGYDSNNNIIWEKDEEGNFVQYVYDGNLLKQKAQRLHRVRTNDRSEYPKVSDINSDYYAITDYEYYNYSSTPNNDTTYMVYGLLKSELQRMDTENIITEYKYHPDGSLKSVKNPQTGQLTLYSEVDYTPDYGWMTTEKSPNGNITEYHYNDNNQLIEVVRKDAKNPAMVSNTVMVYDNCGRKKQEVSANLYEKYKSGGNDAEIGTRYSYNSRGQLESITDAEGNITKYHAYNIYGNIQVEEKPNGGVYKYEYDSLSRLCKVWFKDTINTPDTEYKLLIEYTYVAAKNPVKIEKRYLNESEFARTVYTSDYAGRIIEVVYPSDADGVASSEITTYYGNGKIKEYTDKNGYTTYYYYDDFEARRLQKFDEKWTPVELSGTEVKYNYTKAYYDKAGRIVEEWTSSELVNMHERPSSYNVKYIGYYKDGNVKYVLYNDGRRTDYEYDFDGNLSKEITKKNNSENIVVEYENNYFGKPDSKKLYVDKRDLYTGEITYSGVEVIETKYTYDKEGNLKTVETDDVYTDEDLSDRHTITYIYDNLGRNTGNEEYVVTEDGTVKKLTNRTKFNWEGKPLIVEQLEDDVVTRTNIYTYTQRGFLETVSDAMPAPKTGITYYAYDLGGRKICEVAPNDYVEGVKIENLNRIVYTYDRLDRVLTASYLGKMFYFDSEGKIVEPSTPSTILQKAYTYDKAGNIIKEVDGEYNATQYAYNPLNKVKAVLDAVAEENGFNIENAPKRFNYDALGRTVEEISVMEEKNGTVYERYESIKTYNYDEAGNLESVTVRKDSGVDKLVERAIYDLLGNVISKTDGNGNETIYEYNNLGKVRKVITPGDDSISSNTVYYQYDKVGNIKKIIDTKGTLDNSYDDVYQLYTYDNRGKNLSYTVQKKDGTQRVTTSASYDIYGNKRFETDGNDVTTAYSYDEMNRLVKTSIDVYDDGRITTHTKTNTYDKNGNLISEEDHLNNSITYIYDSMNRLREKVDQYGKTIQKLNYNNDNTQSESFDALNNRTIFEYDKNNNVISTTDAENHTTTNTYDIAGNLKTKDDGRSNLTFYGYDEFKNLTEVSNFVDIELQTTSYTYDLNGNMTSQFDGKNKTIYNYNVGNKLKERFVDGEEDFELYYYYADGNLYQKKDRKGVVTTYTYEADGKIESQTVGTEGEEGFVKTTYIYDGNRNPIIASETTYSNGVSTTIITEREYDELNRVKKKTEYNSTTEEKDRVVNEFVYDIVPSNIPGIMESLEGMVGERSIISKNGVELSDTLKVYDRAGRLKYVVSDGKTTTYEYYDNGNRKSVIYPGGLREEYTYYKDNLLKTLTNYKTVNGVEVEIDKYEYTYDAAHNQDSKTEKINGVSKGKTTFEYDELNRLKKILEPSGRLTEYRYDAAGNREKEVVSFAAEILTESIYNYNAMNWLQTVTKTDYAEGDERTQIIKYSYDKNGNQIGVSIDGIDSVTYGYDNLNRLKKTYKDGIEYNYSFNADGLRIEKAGSEDTTVYTYEYNKVVMELDADGNMIAKNIYGTNLLTRTVDDETLYYMYNGHADVTALVDTEGNVVGSYYYDVWGNIIESEGEMKDKNSILYAGYQYDSETDLYYLNARMYDPKIARFLQEDTYRGDAKDPLSLNLYTYCANNPILLFDPSGNIYVIAWSYGTEDVEAYEQYLTKKGFTLAVDGDTSDWDDAIWNDFTKRSSFARAAYTRKQELLAMGVPESEIDVQRIDGQTDLEATWNMWSGYSIIEGLDFYSHGGQDGPIVYKGTKYRFWENAIKLNFGSTLRNLTVNGQKTAYISRPYAVFYGCHTGEGRTAQVFANNQNVVTYGQTGAASFSYSPYTRYPQDMIITHQTSLGVYLRSYETAIMWNLDGLGKAFFPQHEEVY